MYQECSHNARTLSCEVEGIVGLGAPCELINCQAKLAICCMQRRNVRCNWSSTSGVEERPETRSTRDINRSFSFWIAHERICQNMCYQWCICKSEVYTSLPLHQLAVLWFLFGHGLQQREAQYCLYTSMVHKIRARCGLRASVKSMCQLTSCASRSAIVVTALFGSSSISITSQWPHWAAERNISGEQRAIYKL